MRRACSLVCVSWAVAAAGSSKKKTSSKKTKDPPLISDDVARLRKSSWQSHCKAAREPDGSYLVFTAPRSGSRWFVNTLASRSGGAVSPFIRELALRPESLGGRAFGESKNHGACYGDKVSKECSCALRETFWNELEASARRPDGSKRSSVPPGAPGYKYMLSHEDFLGRPKSGAWLTRKTAQGASHAPPRINAFVASVCDLRTPFVIFQRRNILRILVSRASNEMDKNTAHVHTADAAREIRRRKPTLNARRLESKIQEFVSDQKAIVDLFRHHCGGEWDVDKRVHHYEDMIEASPTSAKHWGKVLYELGAFNTSDAEKIKKTLGGWPTSNQVAIHANRPVLDTVANPKEVEAALRKGKFAWMLTEG